MAALRSLLAVLILRSASGATQSVIEHGFATFESDGTNDVLTVKNQGGSATYLKITAGGNVDIGTTASTINIKGATYTPSDRRLKEDVADVADATTAIDALRGVRYSWIDEAADANGEKRRFIGFLAQEVEAVLPDEAPTTSHFGPRGRVLACFCLALVAVSLRTGRVEAPVVAIPFPTTVDVPPPPFVGPLRRRRFAQFGRLAGRRRNPVSPREERRGLKIGRPGLLVAGGAAAKPILGPVVRFFTRRPVLRKIGGFVARAGLSNTAMRGLRKVLRRAIPVLRG